MPNYDTRARNTAWALALVGMVNLLSTGKRRREQRRGYRRELKHEALLDEQERRAERARINAENVAPLSEEEVREFNQGLGDLVRSFTEDNRRKQQRWNKRKIKLPREIEENLLDLSVGAFAILAMSALVIGLVWLALNATVLHRHYLSAHNRIPIPAEATLVKSITVESIGPCGHMQRGSTYRGEYDYATSMCAVVRNNSDVAINQITGWFHNIHNRLDAGQMLDHTTSQYLSQNGILAAHHRVEVEVDDDNDSSVLVGSTLEVSSVDAANSSFSGAPKPLD